VAGVAAEIPVLMPHLGRVVFQPHRAAALQAVRAQGRHRGRDVDRRLLAFLGGDDDFFDALVFIGRLRRRGGRGRRGRLPMGERCH
jgi:hypothetical protein